jgi:predicted DNA-binding transcriptional regulator AlpA
MNQQRPSASSIPQQTPPRTELNNVVTERDAARYLARSRSFLRIARMRGRGPAYVRLGSRAIGYRLRDLDAFVESRVVRTADSL